VIPKAKGNAARLLEESEGYKQRVIASSEGEASRFKQILVEYNKAPVVTRERLYLDTMQQIFSSTSKIYIDQKSGSNLLYLPLDKLMQMSGPSSSAPASEAPPAPPQEAVPDSAARTREAFRGRERETR